MKFLACNLIATTAAFCLLCAPAGAQNQASVAKPDGTAKASPATPRTADGHLDLSGLWTGDAVARADTSADREKYGAVGFDPSLGIARQTPGKTGPAAYINFERDNTLVHRMGSNKPLYKPKYWETVKKLDQNGNTDDPGYNCMPAGVPRLGPPAQIIQLPKQLVMLYPGQGGAIATTTTYRIIPIDGRKHSNLEDLDGTWNGEAIGHWEGDTMVIDTIGFNTATWIESGGYFHSENMHVIEKFTRNGNALTWQATVEDPDVLLMPWTMDARTVRLNTDPMALLPETPPCSERDFPHAVTKEHH